MTNERIVDGSIDVVTEKGDRVEAKIKSGRITFLDKRDKERTPRRQLKIPEGTIKSLRPLLQEAFGLFGVDQDEGYWEKLAEEAPFAPKEACMKLRRAGISHVEAARLVIESEPRVLEAFSWGMVNDDTIRGFISMVSGTIHREYIRK